MGAKSRKASAFNEFASGNARCAGRQVTRLYAFWEHRVADWKLMSFPGKQLHRSDLYKREEESCGEIVHGEAECQGRWCDGTPDLLMPKLFDVGLVLRSMAVTTCK